MKRKRPHIDIKARIAEIRRQQLAPVDPDAPISIHVNWGIDEATGRPNPPSTDPETLRALGEMAQAAIKAAREGTLPKPRSAFKEQSDEQTQ